MLYYVRRFLPCFFSISILLVLISCGQNKSHKEDQKRKKESLDYSYEKKLYRANSIIEAIRKIDSSSDLGISRNPKVQILEIENKNIYVAYISDRYYYCGSAGCTIFVISRSGEYYGLIGYIGGALPDIEVDTGGYNSVPDIFYRARSDSPEKEYRYMIATFKDRRYIINEYKLVDRNNEIHREILSGKEVNLY